MTDIHKIQTMARELVAKLGIDAVMALAKSARPITDEQLRRAADAVMNRHKPNGEQRNE
jgi:hypothetical protein